MKLLHRNAPFLYFTFDGLRQTTLHNLTAQDFRKEKWTQSECDTSERTRLSSATPRCHLGKVSISLKSVATGLCATVDTSHRDWVPQLARSSKWSVCLLEALARAGNSHAVDGDSTSAWRLNSSAVSSLVIFSPRKQMYDIRITLKQCFVTGSLHFMSWLSGFTKACKCWKRPLHVHLKKFSFLVLAEGKVLPIELMLTLKDRSAFKLTNTSWHSSLACMLLQKCLLG